MKLYIFHGPGIAAQNSRLLELKRKFQQNSIIEINGKDVNERELRSAFSQGLLFLEERLLIIENPSKVEFDHLPSDEFLTIVLTFPKLLPSSSLVLKGAVRYSGQVLSFPEEKEESIFPFLDALILRDPKAFQLFENLLRNFGSQYLLTMMAFSLRRLMNPPKNLPPYILNKIGNQRRNFPNQKIKKLYKAILETDFKIKSGIFEETLAMQLLTQRFFE